jgi:hypothetical protein
MTIKVIGLPMSGEESEKKCLMGLMKNRDLR